MRGVNHTIDPYLESQMRFADKGQRHGFLARISSGFDPSKYPGLTTVVRLRNIFGGSADAETIEAISKDRDVCYIEASRN